MYRYHPQIPKIIDLLKNKDKFEINLILSNNSCITLSTEIVEVTLEDQNKI